MNFEEHAAKPVLRAHGIDTPRGEVVRDATAAAEIAKLLGPCVVKAQVATGKRGKAGGIKLAANPDEAEGHARAILGLTINGLKVEKLLIEEQKPIARELYAAILNDAESQRPLLLFSAEGGIDIEELADERPESIQKIAIDIRKGLDQGVAVVEIARSMPEHATAIADVLGKLYDAYRASDAELIEINPLIVTKDGDLVALDCKLVMDDGAVPRQGELAPKGTPDSVTGLEERAKEHSLKFIELDGEVGVLANGAGLTMTTMDAIRHFGGTPANFLEIGGDSYTKAKPGLELVLANPKVKALLVNFCGAFARTDVMAEGVVKAWQELKPDIPIVFTIHGTGEDEAITMVRQELGVEPHDLMNDAVKAAVEAARSGSASQ